MRKFATIATVAFVSGCATQPEEMAVQYVSPIQYQNYDCEQVSLEMGRVSRRINELYLNLKKTADDDAAQMGVGLVLFWPALFFLEGGDSPAAGEYTRLKGEYEALESVAVKKKCDIPTTAKIAKWAHLARKAVSDERCEGTIGTPTLISATGAREDYQVPCAGTAPVLVRCESEECRALE